MGSNDPGVIWALWSRLKKALGGSRPRPLIGTPTPPAHPQSHPTPPISRGYVTTRPPCTPARWGPGSRRAWQTHAPSPNRMALRETWPGTHFTPLAFWSWACLPCPGLDTKGSVSSPSATLEILFSVPTLPHSRSYSSAFGPHQAPLTNKYHDTKRVS